MLPNCEKYCKQITHNFLKWLQYFQVVTVEDPPVREAGQTVADVDELVGKLKDKGFSS